VVFLVLKNRASPNALIPACFTSTKELFVPAEPAAVIPLRGGFFAGTIRAGGGSERGKCSQTPTVSAISYRKRSGKSGDIILCGTRSGK
jgi:hypothetical protein